MKKTPIKLLHSIVVVLLIGIFLLPLSVKGVDSVKSGGNDMGIEFSEDYVPATSKSKPKPEPIEDPVAKAPIKKIVLPQTGETLSMKLMMIGLLLILGVGVFQQKRREKIEKE